MLAGEGNVNIILNVNNPTINISTWTCTMIIGQPNGTTTTYSVTPSTDGTYASYTTNGTEFPVAGVYNIELHALAPGQTAPNKARVELNVLPGY